MTCFPRPDAPLGQLALLEAVVDGLPDAVLVTDRDGRIVYAGGACQRVFGHPPQGLLGESVRALYPDEHAFHAATGTAAGGPRALRYLHRGGQEFVAETVSSELRAGDGDTRLRIDIVRDPHAAGRARQPQGIGQRLTEALEALDEGFSLWDEEDRLVLSNRRYRELYPVSAPLMEPGAGFEELVRFAVTQGEFHVPAELHEEWVRERVRRHRAPPEVAFEQQHADGHWILVKERPTRGGGIAGIRVDITSQKRTELALRRLAAIGSTPGLGLDDKIARLLTLGMEHFGLPFGVIALREGDFLRLRDVTGAPPGLRAGSLLPADRGPCGRTLDERLVILTGDDVHDGPPTSLQDGLVLRCYLGAAFTLDDGVAGIVAFFASEPRAQPFVDGDFELLRLLAQWVGHEIAREHAVTELDRARDDLERLATTDDLTGLLNRRAILEFGRAEFQRARRYGHPLCALAVDVDFFKRVNDTCGHATGDRVLQAVAECCRSSVRSVDGVGRLGGEEFVVVLVQTGQPYAMEVGERIRLGIACLGGAPGAPVTASIGVAERCESDDDFEALLARADVALYRAKDGGRNRVCLAPG